MLTDTEGLFTADPRLDASASLIEEITAVPEVNKTYLGTVQRIADFGAFVEIMPGTDGLLHVSEIADYRVRDVRDELTEGQQLLVDNYAHRSFHAQVKEKPGHPPLSSLKLLKSDPAAVLAQSEEIKARYSKLFKV